MLLKFNKTSDSLDITTENYNLKFNGNSILDLTYPIGSIFITNNEISPAEQFGGTWERVSEGRCLFGAGTLNNINYVAGTNIDAGLPNIQGSIGKNTSGVNGFYYNMNFNGAFSVSSTSNADRPPYSSSSGGAILGFDASKSNNIYGNSQTVQPNAYVVYMWKRIS